MIRLKLLLIIFLAGLCLEGCFEGRQDIGLQAKETASGTVSKSLAIADIINQKAAYNNKDVVVTGKVLPGLAFEFISEQPYQIIQGDSLLWVITSSISPKENSLVTVRGKIVTPYQIKGRSYQLVLLEEERFN